MKTIVFILLFIFALLLGPLTGIWAINTLLEQAHVTTQIPHNFWTYLAITILMFIFGGTHK